MNFEINVYPIIGINEEKRTTILFTDSLKDVWCKLTDELGLVMVTNNFRNYSNKIYDAIQTKDWNKMSISLTDIGIKIVPTIFEF